MAKKHVMTNAERVRKHRANEATKRQVNLTLHNQTLSKLDRKAKRSKQTRSEFISSLIESGAEKPAPSSAKQNISEGLNTEHQLAVFQALTQIDGNYLLSLIHISEPTRPY